MQVHVAQQHLDLAPDQQALEGRVVDVDVGDVDFFDARRSCASMRASSGSTSLSWR
jgi:hypothetical protein